MALSRHRQQQARIGAAIWRCRFDLTPNVGRSGHLDGRGALGAEVFKRPIQIEVIEKAVLQSIRGQRVSNGVEPEAFGLFDR